MAAMSGTLVCPASTVRSISVISNEAAPAPLPNAKGIGVLSKSKFTLPHGAVEGRHCPGALLVIPLNTAATITVAFERPDGSKSVTARLKFLPAYVSFPRGSSETTPSSSHARLSELVSLKNSFKKNKSRVPTICVSESRDGEHTPSLSGKKHAFEWPLKVIGAAVAGPTGMIIRAMPRTTADLMRPPKWGTRCNWMPIIHHPLLRSELIQMTWLVSVG